MSVEVEPPFQGLVIVPEGSLAEVGRRGERGETLAGLVGRLRERLVPDLELATSFAARLALVHVAPRVVTDDPWLGAIARRGGRAWLRLLDAMDEAIGALGDRQVELEIVARGDDGVAARARLLLRLVRGVEQALRAAGLTDPRREVARVAEAVARADAGAVVDAISAIAVCARGIVEWAPPELALFRVLDASLSRAGGRASIELPVFERPLDAERERDPLDTVIEAIAAALDDAPLTVTQAPSLGDLRMQRGDASGVTVSAEVRRADGPWAQGAAVADAVHASLAAGASPGDILVALVSDDEASALHVLRALEELEIPVVDLRPSRANRSNLVAFANHVLEVAARGPARADVARLLRSSYVDANRVTGEADDAGARKALHIMARCLDETTTAEGSDLGARLAATVMAASVSGADTRKPLARSAEQLGRSLQRVRDATSRAMLVSAAREIYAELGLGNATKSDVGLPADDPLPRTALADLAARGRDADGWAHLTDALVAYEHVVARLGLTDAPADVDTFRHELAWLSARAALSTRGLADAVRLVRLTALPAESAALVVIADADADAWPDGRARAQLVPSPLEERLAHASDPALRPLLQAGAAQVLARLSLGTSHARRVVLTYRIHDDEGRVQSPAPIVAWLARTVPISSWSPFVVVARPLSPRDQTLTELAMWPERAAELLPDAARRARLERRREAAFGQPLRADDPLASTLPRGLAQEAILTDETGGGDRPLSASAVDRLASCVFRGFATEVLRARRRPEAHDIADHREEGNIVHAGLEAAFRGTSSLWSARPRDREAIVRLGLEAADRALERDRGASQLARVVVTRARAGVRAVLDWSIADEDWDFALAEQAFGDGSAWPELVLERPGTRVAIRGRIDRVDVSREGSRVRVIDYKSKASAADAHGAALGVTKFQLALYGRVAQTAQGRAAVTGLYLPASRLRPGYAPRKKHLSQWTDAHATEGGVASFERFVLDRVAALRSGDVAVMPAGEASCEHCDQNGVCRKPRFSPSMATSDDADTEGHAR